MHELKEELSWFQQAAAAPRRCLEGHLSSGRKVVGCLPYYPPEELIWAAGMTPMALWGAMLSGERVRAWFPPDFCSLVQTDLELALRGAYRGLTAVVAAPLCDTLRALTQNWRAAVPEIPILTYSQPQNRRAPYGKAFLTTEYRRLYAALCALSGESPEEARLEDALRLYNRSRCQRRRFAALAALHGSEVLPSVRCAVLKAAGFTDPEAYAVRLTALNDCLEGLPPSGGARIPILTSGILCDHPRLLALLDDLGFTVVGDDVAAESRSFAIDAPEGSGDGCGALAERFARLDRDPLLSGGGEPGAFLPNGREKALAALARHRGARAVVLLRQQFCDPEELLAPAAKAALEADGLPCLILPTDQQTADPGQAATLLETLADLLA